MPIGNMIVGKYAKDHILSANSAVKHTASRFRNIHEGKRKRIKPVTLNDTTNYPITGLMHCCHDIFRKLLKYKSLSY
jgi:hypothetical protein